MVCLEKFAFWVPGMHFSVECSISKGWIVRERPKTRKTCVDRTLTGAAPVPGGAIEVLRVTLVTALGQGLPRALGLGPW